MFYESPLYANSHSIPSSTDVYTQHPYPLPQCYPPNPLSMGSSDIAIASASFGIAVFALFGALLQLMISINIEARRKGKRDHLALGDWAISNTELKLMAFNIFQTLHLSSPWGDPRLTVPFITLGEVENYLNSESRSLKRSLISRRMPHRLVPSASEAIMTGGGRYSGRMYAVRSTTRKSCEACWSDAMDMCGITRKYWNLLTASSAQACDGQVRPANAVTNLHSLCGFGRIMGLRQITKSNNRITMANGGASLYLDLHASVDRPTRLAHFSGSPNGRYLIVEEMSQHTQSSVYADAVWATGCVPDEFRLSPSPLITRPPNAPKFSSKILDVPTHFPSLYHVARNTAAEQWDSSFDSWAHEFITSLSHSADPKFVDLLALVHSPAIVPCIRTFPLGNLSSPRRTACYAALNWCIQHWYLCPCQSSILPSHTTSSSPKVILRPSLPVLPTTIINAEFITSADQSREWYTLISQSIYSPHPPNDPTTTSTTTLIDDQSWSLILTHISTLLSTSLDLGIPSSLTLPTAPHIVLVKFLQTWKLFLLEESGLSQSHHSSTDVGYASPQSEKSKESTEAVLCAITMASIAIATDSMEIGDSEVNKAVEIEFG